MSNQNFLYKSLLKYVPLIFIKNDKYFPNTMVKDVPSTLLMGCYLKNKYLNVFLLNFQNYVSLGRYTKSEIIIKELHIIFSIKNIFLSNSIKGLQRDVSNSYHYYYKTKKKSRSS